ncbi:uncharacterized protein LOC135427541 [Drosophila montana]|uniref:uncharacterized protein LOC135427541 n=1 Tax=Drosophila montana TaxID=40370 RepID=UPI00313B8D1D
MRSYLGFILLISAAAAETSDKMTTTRTTTTTARPEQRNKRQLVAHNAGIGIPIYFDNFNANPPLEPIKPAQPVGVGGNTAGVQPTGFLPGFPQNIPIVGTLLTNLPLQNLLAGFNLGNLGQLGGLGNLFNVGQLGNLPSLGGTKPGGAGGTGGTPPQTCPLTQKLSCRCEPLFSLPVRQPETQLVQILKQNVRHNEDGTQELRLVISNGHVIYHRNDKDASKQLGYYALPIQTGHYLNIHYSINQTNYTIKADVGSSPPDSDFEAY